MNAAFQNWLDSAEIGASGLCFLHCLLLPLTIILMPTLSSALETTEAIHLWSLMIVIPSSLVALGAGARRMGSYSLLAQGIAGLALLVSGALLEETWLLEATGKCQDCQKVR